MAKFMFVFRGGGYAEGGISPTELQAHLAKWGEWTKSLVASGKLLQGEPLSHPPSGRVVRGYDKTITDGPYAESKDIVSGILLVETADLDEAATLALGCPIFERNGSVEVRPVLDKPRSA